jgi:predicted nucleic acid-binding protein
VVDLTSTIIKAQFINLELQMQGIRAADALHITTALIGDADILITGDEHLLSLDSFIPKSNGQVLRCVDTNNALPLIP